MTSDTMAGPNDWLQFYRRNLTGEELPPSPTSSAVFGRVSDTSVVTSVGTPGMNSMGSSTSDVHLNPEGRVAKPSRRRSRASRRTPTTLLNTDTTNFRAMVQQFTGAPSAPFTTGPQTGAPNFNLRMGGSQHHLNTAATIMAPGYHLQQQQQQSQQRFQQQQQQQQQTQQQFQQQQQQLQYMLSMNNNTSRDAFLQRFRDSNQ